MDSGNSDNGTKITSECETGPLFFSGRGRTKLIPEVIAHCTDVQGMSLLARVDGKLKPLGGLTGGDTLFQSADLRGRKFNFKLVCSNSGVPFVFDGITLPIVLDEGYYF